MPGGSRPGIGKRTQMKPSSVYPDASGPKNLAALVDSGKNTVQVAKRFPLEQAGAAQMFLTIKPIGKIVLRM